MIMDGASDAVFDLWQADNPSLIITAFIPEREATQAKGFLFTQTGGVVIAKRGYEFADVGPSVGPFLRKRTRDPAQRESNAVLYGADKGIEL